MAYMTSKGLDIMRNTVIERKKAQEEYGKPKLKFIYLKDGESKRIRFLLDLKDVINIFYHTIPVLAKGKTIFPKFACTQDESCPACQATNKKIKKVNYAFRIPVVDLDEDEVCIWEGSTTTAQVLLNFTDVNETLLGIEFTLTRLGEGLATKYTLTPSLKETEFDISKYEVPEGYDLKVDIEKMKDALKVADGLGDEEEEFNSPC